MNGKSITRVIAGLYERSLAECTAVNVEYAPVYAAADFSGLMSGEIMERKAASRYVASRELHGKLEHTSAATLVMWSSMKSRSRTLRFLEIALAS